jgi:glycosyltransferase involved in cell wall biosynthesis
VGNTARLYYLDDAPTPYRLDVHKRISELWPGQFRLVFCAASEPGRTWSFDFRGLDVQILKGWHFQPARQINPIAIKANPGVWRSLTKFRPDVVVLSGYMQPTVQLAALWCRSHRVPYAIACETSFRSSSPKGFRAVAKRLLVKPQVSNMAFGLPVGREAAEYLRKWGADDIPMYYFPNTPDATKIAETVLKVRNTRADASVRRQYGIEHTEKIVLFVGRMIEAKRPLDLFDAFVAVGERLGGYTLLMAGDGPLLPQLRHRAAHLRNVRLPGWISEPEAVFKLMAIASVMVLPSQHEPWGAVVNEAMAAGVPVIASDRVGAAVELIENGRNGFIFEAGNIAQLTEVLIRALSNTTALAAVGQAAQATALAQGHEFAAKNLVSGALAAIGTREAPSAQSI